MTDSMNRTDSFLPAMSAKGRQRASAEAADETRRPATRKATNRFGYIAIPALTVWPMSWRVSSYGRTCRSGCGPCVM
jgi:hypothetical protein